MQLLWWERCPLNSDCLIKTVTYTATDKKEEANNDNYSEMIYIDIKELNEKNRKSNCSFIFTNKKYASSTTLSKHVW